MSAADAALDHRPTNAESRGMASRPSSSPTAGALLHQPADPAPAGPHKPCRALSPKWVAASVWAPRRRQTLIMCAQLCARMRI
jgi:hypothetical protein